jgi:hypothetical protein
VTTNPSKPLPNGVEPTVVHDTPSEDIRPTTTPADTDNRSQTGSVAVAPAINVVSPPGALLVMNSTPPSGLTSRITCGDEASSVRRTMTPAFANGCPAEKLSTRATTPLGP